MKITATRVNLNHRQRYALTLASPPLRAKWAMRPPRMRSRSLLRRASGAVPFFRGSCTSLTRPVAQSSQYSVPSARIRGCRMTRHISTRTASSSAMRSRASFSTSSFRRARDVASRVGVWEGFHAPYWHWALLVGLRPDPGELGVSRASGPLVRSASMPREGLTGAGDHQISDLLCESKARTRMGKRSERPTLD